MEIRTLQDYPTYYATEDGHIVKEKTGQALAVRINNTGVPIVNLRENGDRFTRSAAPLIGRAFEVEYSMTYVHWPMLQLNGDRTDLRPSNMVARPKWFCHLYLEQLRNPEQILEGRLYVPDEDLYFDRIRELSTHYGWLENDIFRALFDNDGRVWPHAYGVRLV